MPIKYLRNKALFLGILAIGLCAQISAQNSIEITQHSSESGILQPFIYAINQDSQGYLWVGTGKGVYKYDGFNFQSVYAGDSLAENYISVGFTDKDENIWWGHQQGKITCYKNGKFITIGYKEMPKARVNDIRQDSLGNIWYISQAGSIVKVLKNGVKIFSKPFVNLNIQSFEFASGGLMLLGTDAGVLLYQVPTYGEPFKLLKVHDIPTTTINHISKAQQKNTYWIGTEDQGLFKLKVHSKIEGFVKTMSVANGYDLKTQQIRHILEDRNNNLWISTYGEGIFKANYSKSLQNYIDIQNICRDYNVESLDINQVFEDREGNIWVGSQGSSLYFIQDNIFEQYLRPTIDGKHRNVRSILVDDSSYYYGTKGKIIIEKKADNQLTSFNFNDSIPDDLITAIYKDDKNNIWIGTEDNGAYVMFAETQTFVPLNLSKDNLASSVNSISGGDQFIWIATKFGLFKYNTITGTHEKFSTQDKLKHNNISQLYKDPRTNDIWVATQSNYLSRIRGSEITDFEIKESNSILNISSVYGDSKHNIWIATLGNGVYKFDVLTKTFTQFTKSNQLLNEYCYSLIIDDLDNVWIGHC